VPELGLRLVGLLAAEALGAFPDLLGRGVGLLVEAASGPLVDLFLALGQGLAGLVAEPLHSFFFLYLLRLLNVIDTPFKVGQERTDDDVSLFLLTEFIVYATARPGGEPRGASRR
jgi:hypothetical protein